ncbi:hypothetical protein BAE44_0019339 [Dichanthelium oligosanthes]|uniref:Uncharacterized protein n=1 Tax=Dichanthelium oligosanthes TaxID=888268 RepID=A0A1E5V3A6_9POAL|nr:hypothetical protein BAE44_0019339 [Dichanthelium oligosanthes]
MSGKPPWRHGGKTSVLSFLPCTSQHSADDDGPPPQGPGSGLLVVVEEATERASTRCWGLCLGRELRSLPFPQNRQVALRQSNGPDPAEACATCIDFLSEIVGRYYHFDSGSKAPTPPEYVMLVPVVGQPLSSRRYYVVELQQLPSGSKGFKTVAVTTDGIPPHYLRKKGWKANTMASRKYGYDLADDAQGVDSALRRRMPDLDGLSVDERTSSPPVVVGKWYVPFMFVKVDGELRRLKDKFQRCMYYQMTMEQSWEQIYSREGTHHNPGSGSSGEPAEVAVSATVLRSTALLGGTNPVQEGGPQEEGGAVWFRPAASAATATVGDLGLGMVVWERMRWEVERGGWVAPAGNGADEERIERVERRDGGLVGQHWHKFGCYLLVERIVLRRTDGSVALTCEFRHTVAIVTFKL